MQALEPGCPFYQGGHGADECFCIDGFARQQIQAGGVFTVAGATPRQRQLPRHHRLQGDFHGRLEISHQSQCAAFAQAGDGRFDGGAQSYHFDGYVRPSPLGLASYLGGNVALICLQADVGAKRQSQL